MTEIELLRTQVETSVGFKLQTPKDFTRLSECIYNRLHLQISSTTLKRIWGYQQDEGPSRVGSLDILSQFCGYRDWQSFEANSGEDFCQSALILNRCVYADELVEGQDLLLTWAPKRRCKVSYLGNHRFEILEAENTKLKAGSTFKCDVMIENEPLYLYDLKQDQQPAACYSAGRKEGIQFEILN